jgi:hypothetical protein
MSAIKRQAGCNRGVTGTRFMLPDPGIASNERSASDSWNACRRPDVARDNKYVTAAFDPLRQTLNVYS